MASMFVVARFSPVREHVEEGPTLESWHFASVSMAALLASFFVLLIPVDTASKPAAEAPLIPRRRQRHATKSFPGKDEYWKSRLLRESTQHLESIASTKANRGPKAAEDTDDTYTI